VPKKAGLLQLQSPAGIAGRQSFWLDIGNSSYFSWFDRPDRRPVNVPAWPELIFAGN
jgi:hypothetical protein